MLGFYLFSTVVVILCLIFLWKRSRLYYYSSKIPGPVGLPFIGEGYRLLGSPSAIFKMLLDMFDEYPGLGKAWLGPDLYFLVSKPQYLETIFNHPGAYEKSKVYKLVETILTHGLVTAPASIWYRHRKIIAPTFNSTILIKFMEIFTRNAEILIKKLENLPKNQIIDIFTPMSNCTLDITCEGLFGVQIDAQINNSTYGQTFSAWMDIVFLKLFKLWYRYSLTFKFTKHYKEELRYVEETHSLAEMIIKKKQEALELNMKESTCIDDSGNKPFLEHVLTSKKQSLTYQEIKDETITLLIAATDTTATTLSFMMLLLGLYPNIQEQLYAEVVDILGNDKSVEIDDLPNLKYTERVIKESLRLFPGGSTIGRSLTQDIVLDDGIVLPKGSEVVLGIMHIHRNAKYWPDPLKFDPDRFLPEEISKRHPYTWVPFSGGNRNCIGGKMAMMLMKTVLAMTIRRFKVKTDYKSVEDVEIQMGVVTKPKYGYKVYLESR